MMTQKNYYDWTIDCLLEVKLSDPDDFLKIKETLTRIGVASRTGDILYQSCNILHKQGVDQKIRHLWHTRKQLTEQQKMKFLSLLEIMQIVMKLRTFFTFPFPVHFRIRP